MTTHPNTDVSNLTNRDIERIIKSWQKGKPVAETAGIFRLLANESTRSLPGSEKFRDIQHPDNREEIAISSDPETEELILASYHASNLSPTHLEKKIEEIHGLYLTSYLI